MILGEYDKQVIETTGSSRLVRTYNPAWSSRYPDGIPSNVIEITDEQYKEYFDKGIVQRQDDGTLAFVYVAPPEPTTAELQQQAIAALDAEYEPQFSALTQAWATANMDGNTTLADSIKQDKVGLTTEYQAKRQAIING